MRSHLISALLAALALAPDAAPAQLPAVTPPTLPAQPGDPGVFLLEGGARLAGTLLESGPQGDTLELRSGGRVALAPGKLVGRLSGPEGWSGAVEEAPAVRLETRGGTVAGRLVGRAGGALELRRDDGTLAHVPEIEVLRASFVGELSLRRTEQVDPGRFRYVTARRGHALGAGQWMLRSSLESALEVAYGVADPVTVTAAFESPVLYGHGAPVTGVRLDVTGNVLAGPVRLSGGATASRTRGAVAVTLHGEATLGSARDHVTVFAGPPLASVGRLGEFDAVVLGAAGTVRLWGPTGVVGEAWLTPRTERPAVAGALALRVLFGHFALDLGAIMATTPRTVPWIAVSFDGGREAP